LICVSAFVTTPYGTFAESRGHNILSRQVAMRSTLPIIIGVSLMIAAVAWGFPFVAPMACSYWASGIWGATVIAALALHGKRGLWVFLGTPLALWHAAFAALIYIAWR
jgi:hypothetical protein